MQKFLFLFFSMIVSVSAFAEKRDPLFKDGSLVNFAPPVINKQYYLIEYGFMVKKRIKKWDYGYNAFVNASLFEDWKDRTDNLHAGALGFKGGVLFPLVNTPLFYRVAVGFAKSVLHKNPIFGNDKQSVSKKTMFLFELGGVYNFDPVYVGLNYQVNNVRFFTRHVILSVGVNY